MTFDSSFNGSGSFRSIFEANMPSSGKPISHDSAAVLLLSYDSNDGAFTDLHVQEEIDGLEHVFRNEYGFEVDKKVIESKKSAQVQMSVHLGNFVLNHGKEHALLIVYYGGHGSHSDDERRSNPGRFDLHPKRNYPKSQPHGKGLIMWEACERLLHDAKGDVLVIFDSCDTGTLASLRSTGCAFEYFVACEQGRFTHGPGDYSFTTALTWALKELRSESPFTTKLLASKVKGYKGFPTDQKPVLFTRMGYVPEHIWISSIGTSPVTCSTQRQQVPISEFRDENCDYVDFRVTFNRSLSDKDGKDVATLMAPLVTNQELPLSARHVSILKKGICTPSSNPTARWTLLRNHLLASRRFQAMAAKQDRLPNQKRKRPSLEIFDKDTSLTNALESASNWGVEGNAQLSRITSSESYERSFEDAMRLDNDTLVKVLPTVIKSPAVEEGQDPVDCAKPSTGDLQKLMTDVIQHPQVCNLLRSQIRDVLAEKATQK